MIGFRFPRSALRAFLANEAAGGIVLIVATALAIVVANLPATSPAYHALLHARTGPVLAPALGPLTVPPCIHDGLIAVIFLPFGPEHNAQFIARPVSQRARRGLPVIHPDE